MRLGEGIMAADKLRKRPSERNMEMENPTIYLTRSVHLTKVARWRFGPEGCRALHLVVCTQTHLKHLCFHLRKMSFLWKISWPIPTVSTAVMRCSENMKQSSTHFIRYKAVGRKGIWGRWCGRNGRLHKWDNNWIIQISQELINLLFYLDKIHELQQRFTQGNLLRGYTSGKCVPERSIVGITPLKKLHLLAP